MENRYINIKVTDNSGKVSKKAKGNIKGVGDQAKKTGVVAGGAMAAIGTGLKGISTAAVAATAGIRTMTLALISSGVGAIVVAIGALVAGFVTVVKASNEFAVSQSNLKAVLQGTNEEMAALSQNAQDLGKSTVFTATQVTEMQLELGKLGFTTTQILDATAGALDLAAASGSDLATSAQVAANTLNGFGLEAEETNRVVDVMALSFTTSALDLSKFAESMKLVAPIAKTTNTSIEEASAALAILADRGVAGSRAGTQLRRVMSDLAVKTGKSFQESLEITSNRLENAATNADKLKIAKELVGDRAKGSLIALAENREELFKLAEGYENAEGSAKKMAAIRLDNLTGDTTLLKSAMQGLMLSIEDGQGVFSKLARGGIQLLTKTVEGLTIASEYLGFIFPDIWDGMKLSASGSSEFLAGQFDKLGAKITIFANKALLSIAEIPIIGAGLDKEKIRDNIDKAVDALAEANDRIENAQEIFGKSRALAATRSIRFIESQKAIEVERAEKERRKLIQETEEGITEDALAEEKTRQEKVKALRAKLKKEQEDAEADDKIKKLELKKQRAIDEVNDLVKDATLKRELLKQIDDTYDSQIEEAKIEKQEKDAADIGQMLMKEFKILDDKALKEKELQDKIRKFKIDTVNAGLDAAIYAAGEESKVGKALFVIKQALAIKELIYAAKNALAKAAMNAAEGTGEVAKGAAKATATLNPFIIASYAVAAAGVVASIISAFSASKRAAAQAGVSGGGGGIVSSEPKSPSFNLIGNVSAGENKIATAIGERNSEVVKAYVVSDEIQTGLALERNINQTASIG